MTDLSQVKVGDKVCLEERDRWGTRRLYGLRVGTVEKVTATQITALGDRWQIKSGRRVGDGGDYNAVRLVVWTPELQAEADHGRHILKAEDDCSRAGSFLQRMRGEDALRMVALLPSELMGGK